jgi:short subunit dehydrogenase-like uncharacterized protein
MSQENTLLVYGANGYSGRLITDRCHSVGMRPILAGRRADAVAPIAERYSFEHRAFSLESPAQIAHSLEGVRAVLLAAGPFSRTSAPMLEACIAAGVHYLDITGEIAVFEHCFAQHARAANAGVVVLPGTGFDVVPSDCLAATLAHALPDARSLELAFCSSGASGSRISPGTAKTMLEGIGEGGAVRQDGHIRRVPVAWRTGRVPFRDRERDAVSIPWGDVATAFESTGIPNIVVYTVVRPWQIRGLKVASVLAPLIRLGPVRHLLARRIERSVHGPGEAARGTTKMQLWGRVTNAAGRSVEGTLVTPEGYRLTAETSVESARRIMAGTVEPGCSTPSRAFGAAYITAFDECDLRVGAVR